MSYQEPFLLPSELNTPPARLAFGKRMESWWRLFDGKYYYWQPKSKGGSGV